MSILDYSVLRNEDYGTNPPFKSDETGLHGDAEFPIAVYHADVTNNFVSWHWHEELEFGFAVEGSVLMECGKNKHILFRNKEHTQRPISSLMHQQQPSSRHVQSGDGSKKRVPLCCDAWFHSGRKRGQHLPSEICCAHNGQQRTA